MAHSTNEFPYTIKTLEDGLRIVHVHMPNAQSVAMQIYVGAGSRYEEPEISGISHFLEHMAFKGTTKRPTAKDVSLAIEGIGGILNAWTSEEATAYWCKLPATHFEAGFEVLSDMLVNSTLPEEEIKREAQVILQEMAREEDSPDQRVFEVFTDLMYPNQALGRRVIGSEKTLLKIRRENLYDYIDSLYGPQNTVVSIAGPMKTSQVVATIKQYLRLPKRELRRGWEPYQAKIGGGRISIYPKETEQIHMILGLSTFPRDDKRTPTISVLNTILGYGMSSRLFVNVRERKGLAYSIGSGNEYFHDTGMWFCYGGIVTNKIDLAIEGVLSELKLLQDELVSDQELAEAKEKVRGRFVLGLETTNALADYYGKQILLEKEVETPLQWLEKIEDVTAGDIRTLAQTLFTTENLHLALIGAKDTPEHFESLLKI